MKIQKNIKNIARQVLINEANAIMQLADFIDDQFEACVEEILKSNGRLVVTGIGKSANIGNKIVSTLNSTGTPSLFMHAADAIHGDLGMIQPSDIVICISKSGNTPEIKVLVPLLKRKGAKLVALVGNTESYLAQQADYVLNASIEKEADPNNLAPTSSTTAALALGDALAVCLLEKRNFGSNDFAQLHPGGALGKQLYLKVSDLCKDQKVPSVALNTSLPDVILEISSKRLGATAVTNASNSVLGIITDGDLRRMLSKKHDLTGIVASDLLTSNPKSITPEAYAVEALELMRENNITQLVVINNKKLIGFVHLHDLLKEGIV